MPITAKFSREFYEKFGHEAVDELVNFLNGIDTGYRLELRELNDRNFARLDDRLEHRLSELDTRLQAIDGRIDRLESRIGGLETALSARVKAVESGLEVVNGRLDRLERRVETMDQKMSKQFYWLIGGHVAVLLSIIGTLSAALFLR